ncbi:hypothetical protein Trco_001765 [Trichoderma cornu-damae]|uniref:Uncharacterized protein n=1 Tax=Trichoderma cornu-damae TaxID=654480 RepID=A0A9P8TX74_9HYPO|nr:hypothetical protein Trco_001765 [Trichoderma cornu-damae]
MPAGNATEDMALLGQHGRFPDPSVADATGALTYRSGYVSQRLELVLSQCQTDDEIDRELRDDFEVHRRSANRYMNQYLDCLRRVCEERSRHVYEINDDFEVEAPATMELAAREPDSGVTREQWRLKISRDCLTRDLLAMQETLEVLKGRADRSPRKSALPISAVSFSTGALSLMLWRSSHPVGAVSLVLANAAAAACCYYSSEVQKWRRVEQIMHYQENIQALQRRLSRGEVDEWNRKDLTEYRLNW